MSKITNQPLYLIKFDDAEVPDETMFGAEVANKRFEQISGNWNAHLFVKVASNSRDDACSGSNAKLASDYEALAAQRDEGLAREAELRTENSALRELHFHAFEEGQDLRKERDTLQQRLAEAKTLLRSLESSWNDHSGRARHSETMNEVEDYLASPGCADGEKSE